MFDLLNKLHLSTNNKIKSSTYKIIENIIHKLLLIKRDYKNNQIYKTFNVKKEFIKEQFQTNALFNSHYIDNVIKEDIILKSKYIHTYSFDLLNRNIKVHFILYDNFPDMNFKKYIEQIYNMLYLLIPYSNIKCSKKLEINIIFTEFKKVMPRENHTILNSKHVNSGISYSCNESGNILIYRYEEWYKVLIHEIIHSLGLDFSNQNNNILFEKMNNRFCVRSNFYIYETYTEFWAILLHTIYKYSEILNSTYKYEIKNNIQHFIILINNEIKFSMYQTIKILWYMNTNYNNIINPNMCSQRYSYKEDTNVFSYYILKFILLYFYEDFIMWCNINNENLINFQKTNNNIILFDKFIQQYYKNELMINDIRINEDILSNLIDKNKIKNNELFTMRMSLYG